MKLIALLLTVSILSACGNVKNEDISEDREPEELAVKTDIIIGTSEMTGSFSPFFTAAPGGADVMSVINAPLVTLDRRGEVVRNAVTGETRVFGENEYHYKGISDVAINMTDNNTTVLTFRLREDVRFSDGGLMTADDLIFTLYAFFDIDYNGEAALSLLPVLGADYYRTNADADTYLKYSLIAAACLEAGRGFDFEQESEVFTEEQYALFYECYEEAWISHVKAIVEYSANNFAGYAHVIGEGNLQTDEWMQAALAMMVWRVADFTVITPATEENEAVYGAFTSVSGREWNLTNSFPTIYDFYREFYEIYEGNLEAYINAEKIGRPQSDNALGEVVRLFIEKVAATDPENTGAGNIVGIRKIGGHEVTVTLAGYVPAAVYSFILPVAPLHYYGDLTLYDYAGDKFGFERGNLSVIREKNNLPLGAGPYALISFENGVAVLEANEFYFKGKPEITELIFRETNPDDMIFDVASGVSDITAVAAMRDVLNEINAYEEAGVWMQKADYGTFGYIGFNAERVGAEGEPLSEESVSFRKGIATILAAYREISISDFYGEAADVAEYPVSGVSWAAPRIGDSGYKEAFSIHANGANIFTTDLTEARRLEAAKTAALGFFEAAGCELNASGSVITSFPDDIRNSYEVYIVGFGTGRHPSYLLLTMAAATLRTVGINIEIKDVSSQGEMYSAVINGEADMWCGAWQGEVLPGASGRFASSGTENFFRLSDEMLDQRLALADSALNLEFYRSAFDSVLDSAVCVPVYQRKVYFVFGGTLEQSSVEGGLTTHYGWADVIEKIRVSD
ncbi:MAG: ABC transporter substrate-binding protein [Oscillospiraceae bacterium]|nr:ABC transporter substrate-binding protein [Oscillospiraceae bacterium]